MAKTKTVKLTLLLKTTKRVEELKQSVLRLSKTPGIVKIEQVFPDALVPILGAMCLVKVKALKIASVLTVLANNKDVKSVRITPLRKRLKRKR